MDYKKVKARALKLLEDHGEPLNIIYARVSTTDKNQNYEDQIPQILKTFNLERNNCLVIKAKESAYKKNKDKTRVLNVIIKELIKDEDLEDSEKILYLWDLDRLYRNQKKQAEFVCYFADKHDCKVLSHRQKWLAQLKKAGGIQEALYKFLIEMFGNQAEEESKKRSDRVLKSLKHRNGRVYSSNNKIVGRRMIKKVTSTGKKIFYTIKELDKIEAIVMKMFNKGYSYQKIKDTFLEKKDITLSNGFLFRTKEKHLNNDKNK